MLVMRKIIIPIAVAFSMCLSITCGDAEIILPDALSIVAVEPSHGSINISTGITLLVVFSHELQKGQDFNSLFTLTQSSTQTDMSTTNSLLDDGYVVEIVPEQALARDTEYEFTIKAGVAASDDNVKAIPIDVVSNFTTAQ